jgi:methyltransferase family protein
MEQPPGESCCYASEYGDLFGRRGAGRDAKAYLKKGLSRSARDLVDALVGRGVGGASVLEIGGGVGAIQIELLAAGAERATNVDLSTEWEEAAAALLAQRGMSGKVDRRLGDFVAVAGDIEPADVVVLHRVVCCYPDWRRLLGLATERAGSALAITFPRDRWQNRVAVAIENFTRRIRGRQFRAFVHPSRPMLELIERAGFRVTSDRSGAVWRSVVLHRSGGATLAA